MSAVVLLMRRDENVRGSPARCRAEIVPHKAINCDRAVGNSACDNWFE